jgi:type IV secretory pathway VirJ component
MKNLVFLLLFLPLSLFAAKSLSEDSLSYSHFGVVHIFRNQNPPEGVLIYISGDGALNRAALNMARPFADMNVIVIAVNYVHFIRSLNSTNEKCLYPAGDFENLSMFVQKKLKLTKYFKPILVGFSSGATLAYAMLVQAPANTFKGAIGIGFCPDVKSAKPFCAGNGLKSHVLKQGKSFYLERFEKLTAPFIVFQGERDMICDAAEDNAFLKGMKNAEIYNLPTVGHGFVNQTKWMPQMKEAVKKIIDTQSFGNKAPIEATPGVNTAAISQLPLYLIKAADNPEKPLCIIISGDGGWTDFDQSVSEGLARNGISCVGLDTQKYFWEAKTPDATAQDITKVLQYYMPRLQKSSFILVGYSFGADVIPFIANRLPADLKKRLSLIAMLSPDDKTDFEVTISSMLDLGSESGYDVLKEIKKVIYTKKLCIFGSEEDDEDMVTSFKSNGAEVMVLGGGHHYDENYPLIVSTILKHM